MHDSGLYKRLMPLDLTEEFKEVVRLFDDGMIPIQYCALDKHFAVYRERRCHSGDYGPMLSISIGGSNTKIMLAKMSGGVFKVIAFSASKNPMEPIGFHNFLDSMMKEVPLIREYIAGAKKVCVGVSVPMVIKNGVPFHVNKVGTINGLVARNEEDLRMLPTVEDNIKSYVAKYNPEAELMCKCQSDGIVAHLGAVATGALNSNDRSLLAVCGTGFATSDDKYYIIPTCVPYLQDSELYPLDETENGQFQYAVSGKGVYSVMRRAIGAASRNPGSAPGLHRAADYFQDARDSKLVFDLWSISVCGAEPCSELKVIRDDIGEDAFRELVCIAESIGNRSVNAIASCIVATLLYVGNPENDGNFHVYFEGGIATDPFVLPKIKSAIGLLVSDSRLYQGMGKVQPKLPAMDNLTDPVEPENCNVTKNSLKHIDYSVIGACALVIAEDMLRS